MKHLSTGIALALLALSLGQPALANTPGGSDYSVQYNLGSAFTGDSNLIWNPVDSLLGLRGAPATIAAQSPTTTNASGSLLRILGSDANGDGDGGDIRITAGSGGGSTHDGGDVTIESTAEGSGGGASGDIVLSNYGDGASASDGSIDLIVGSGLLRLKHLLTGAWAIFDPSSLTANRTYALPDRSGTLALRDHAVALINADYTMTNDDPTTIIAFTDVSSLPTVTLPSCSSQNIGRLIIITDTTGSAHINTPTLQAVPGELIDTGSYAQIPYFNQPLFVFCGSPGNWFMMTP